MTGYMTSMMEPDTQSTGNTHKSTMSGTTTTHTIFGRMRRRYVSTWSMPSTTIAVTLPEP